MKIYVAGSSKDIDRCEAMVAACRAMGLEITVDWVAVMRASPPDSACDATYLETCARNDIRGVKEADVVWVVGPSVSKPSTGCWGELTAALALGKPVLYSAPPRAAAHWPESVHAQHVPQFCIFTTLAERFESDGDVLAHLVFRAAEFDQKARSA